MYDDSPGKRSFEVVCHKLIDKPNPFFEDTINQCISLVNILENSKETGTDSVREKGRETRQDFNYQYHSEWQFSRNFSLSELETTNNNGPRD